MKNQSILISLYFLLFCITATLGQTERGNVQIGGELSYQKVKNTYKNPGSTDINENSWLYLNTKIGYFIGNNFVVGLIGGRDEYKFVYTHSSGINSSLYKNPRYYIGPYVRYYKMFGDQIGIWGQASVNFAKGRIIERNYYANQESKITDINSSDLSVAVSPGVVFFPSKRIGLELTLGEIKYVSRINKTDNIKGNGSWKSFNFNFDLRNLGLGLMFYL